MPKLSPVVAGGVPGEGLPDHVRVRAHRPGVPVRELPGVQRDPPHQETSASKSSIRSKSEGS